VGSVPIGAEPDDRRALTGAPVERRLAPGTDAAPDEMTRSHQEGTDDAP
jgi:hypothetical protein